MSNRSSLFKHILYLFVAMFPVGIIVGGVASYLGIYIGPFFYILASIPAMIGDKAGLAGPIFSFTTFLLILAAFLTPPALIAALLSGIVGRLAKKGQCQNATLVGISGAWNGMLAYAAHTLISLHQFGSPRFLTQNNIIPPEFGEFGFYIGNTSFKELDLHIAGVPFVVILLIIIEVLIIVIYGYKESRQTVLS